MAADEIQGWYTAFKAKDARFDGRFFVGVSSTGIYCRPVCQAKLPKAENCTYFATAAAAELANYRPCLLCRPELAPGLSVTDATASLVNRAALMIEETCGAGYSLEDIASRLGYTDRHLRRAFRAAYDVSPVQYLQTCRLLLAKNLLTDTDLSVMDVAMSAGFGSLRRFNSAFKTHYRLSPTALRKQTSTPSGHQDSISLSLGYRPPYPWQQTLEFFAHRLIPGVEVVRDGAYFRTACLTTAAKEKVSGWVGVYKPDKKDVLRMTVSTDLLPALPQVLGRIRHLFDLNLDPDAVHEVLSSMEDIRPGACVKGTRLPGCFDTFEMVVRAVLGQQISVKAAHTVAGRLTHAYGTPIETGIEGLTHTFPTPQDISALEGDIANHLGPLGITSAKARTIQGLATAFASGDICLDLSVQPEVERDKLLAIPGIGKWTAGYIMMRAMGWPDSFLETDVGIRKALAPLSEADMLELANTWRPWRSYAMINLWNAPRDTN